MESIKTSPSQSPTTITMTMNSVSSIITQTSMTISASSSSTQQVTCSQITCSNGCTFLQISCKCVNTTSNTECQLTTASDAQTSNDTSMETWKIALLVGCSVFLVLFIIIFIYFKKRQHRGRGFNIQASNGQRRQLEMKDSPPGRDNGAFIIEERSNGNRPTAEMY